MATLTKPSTFRRSSERKVTDPNEERVIREDRLREKEREAFEAIGFTPAAASVHVTRSRITDESNYDLEGIVRP